MTICNFARRSRGHKLDTSNWRKAIGLFITDFKEAALNEFRTNSMGTLGSHTVQWRVLEFCSKGGFKGERTRILVLYPHIQVFWVQL